MCTFCLLTFSGCKPSEPFINETAAPDVEITAGGESLFWISSLHSWNGEAHTPENAFKKICGENDKRPVPRIPLGENIAISFNGTPPDSAALYDGLLYPDGSTKYDSRLINTTEAEFTDGKYSFPLGTHMAAFASSDSRDYEPGNTWRGFRLVCTWGENICEYAFVLRTDVSFERGRIQWVP